jgi:hypothetical protein
VIGSRHVDHGHHATQRTIGGQIRKRSAGLGVNQKPLRIRDDEVSCRGGAWCFGVEL